MVTLRNIFILSATILVTTNYSCSDKGTNPFKHPSTYPLAVGNYWHYKTSLHEISLHHVLPSDSSYDDCYRRVIAADTFDFWDSLIPAVIIQDSIGHPYRPSPNIYDLYALYWQRFQNSKLEEFAMASVDSFYGQIDTAWGVYDCPKIIADFPLTRGKTWNYDIGCSRHPSPASNSVTGSRTIRLGMGTFDCDIIRSIQPEFRGSDTTIEESYYSDPGLVYQFVDFGIQPMYDPDSGQIVDSARVYETYELMDYQIEGE
jgi:hypothetical protein